MGGRMGYRSRYGTRSAKRSAGTKKSLRAGCAFIDLEDTLLTTSKVVYRWLGCPRYVQYRWLGVYSRVTTAVLVGSTLLVRLEGLPLQPPQDRNRPRTDPSPWIKAKRRHASGQPCSFGDHQAPRERITCVRAALRCLY